MPRLASWRSSTGSRLWVHINCCYLSDSTSLLLAGFCCFLCLKCVWKESASWYQLTWAFCLRVNMGHKNSTACDLQKIHSYLLNSEIHLLSRRLTQDIDMGTTCISTMMFGPRPKLASHSSTGKQHDCDCVYAFFFLLERNHAIVHICHFSAR
jgi:hypothetical protein